MDLGLTGRVALVTGASKGIGRAIALTLAAEGMDVAIVARSREPLEALKKEIEAKGRKAVAIAADLADPAAAQPAIDAAVKAFGKLDLLVNCAGATKGGSFLTLSDADWTDSFGLKFSPTFVCRSLRGRISRHRAAASFTSRGSRGAPVPAASTRSAR
jgi:NAD(P)-dependent dehydrogenase (short-subunit alcohol dehydrogenase family)